MQTILKHHLPPWSTKLRLASLAAAVVGIVIVVLVTQATVQAINRPAKSAGDLTSPAKREAAFSLVSSAENSSTNWRAQYSYLEDIGDGRGYTGGLIGFCSGTGDMLQVVIRYAAQEPTSPLATFVPALTKVNGSDSHAGLGRPFEVAWRIAATDPKFRADQEAVRDEVYFNPAVKQAQADGLQGLGQYIYYDAIVMHGPGEASDGSSFQGIRAAALRKARSPQAGGSEEAYLQAFLDARRTVMLREAAHRDTDRLTVQHNFLKQRNFTLTLPLHWTMYGDKFQVSS